METSGFFNAEILADGSYDRIYVAEQFAKYFSRFIGNGVFVTPASQLKVVPKQGEMGVGISIGDAYINGFWYQNDSIIYKNLDPATGTQSRIDRVVLRWDSSTRSIYVDVLTGVPSAFPESPALTRTADAYELALADIAIGKAATEVKDENITDLRNNSSLCGYVKGVVDQIDATNLFSQFTAAFNSWFNDLKDKGDNRYNDFDKLLDQYSEEFSIWFNNIKGQLDEDAATKLAFEIEELKEKDNELIDKIGENSESLKTKANKSASKDYTLLASAWNGDTQPYACTLSVEGVTDSNNVELIVASTVTLVQVEAFQNAMIITGTQAIGSITLKAFGEKPSIDLPIVVIVRGD